jgi:VanZ like protein
MAKLKATLFRWGPPVLWMAAIFLASATPSTQLPRFGSWDFVVKKGGHVLSYGLLGLLFRRGLGWERRNVAGAWLLTVMYALVDEFHQSFVPGRHPSLVDVFAFDGLGAALALWLSWRLYHPLLNSSADRSAKT